MRRRCGAARVIALNPADPTGLVNRGRSYAEKGDYDRAIEDFNQAVRLNELRFAPPSSYALYHRGLACCKTRRGVAI
jgi:tetratricopeptide (TPR) repeat protein